MPVSHEWRHITDLPEAPEKLTDGELNSLARVWESQQRDLSDRGVLDEFNRRLRREWSIETGVIENVYTLDRGVTNTLIEKGIDAALIPHGASDKDSVAVARIIQDHYDALEGMFDFVYGQRVLTTGYVKELHAALLRNQRTHSVVDQFDHIFEKTLELGKYKDFPNSPTRQDGSVHQYCPPEHVGSEMDQLIEIHQQHVKRGIPAEVQAAWLHHRFTQIHPFADGNGRVARALASLVFIKARWFPLIVKRDDWPRYIDALEKADGDELKPLVDMFVEAQRDAVIMASELAYDVQPIATTDEAILAVRDRLIERGRLPSKEWLAAKATTHHLVDFTTDRFGKVALQLNQEIAKIGGGFNFLAQSGPSIAGDDIHMAVARSGQIPDFDEFDVDCRLSLNSGRQEALVISFHGIGPRFRGFVGAVALFSRKGSDPTLIPGGTFQINYEESLDSAQARFSSWLERAIVAGLAAWRRSL